MFISVISTEVRSTNTCDKNIRAFKRREYYKSDNATAQRCYNRHRYRRIRYSLINNFGHTFFLFGCSTVKKALRIEMAPGYALIKILDVDETGIITKGLWWKHADISKVWFSVFFLFFFFSKDCSSKLLLLLCVIYTSYTYIHTAYLIIPWTCDIIKEMSILIGVQLIAHWGYQFLYT